MVTSAACLAAVFLVVIVMKLHPGTVLRRQFLEPLHLSQNALGRSIGVSARRINEIVSGERMITADTALRLAKFFATTAYFWLNLQMAYDLERKSKELKEVLRCIKVFEKCN